MPFSFLALAPHYFEVCHLCRCHSIPASLAGWISAWWCARFWLEENWPAVRDLRGSLPPHTHTHTLYFSKDCVLWKKKKTITQSKNSYRRMISTCMTHLQCYFLIVIFFSTPIIKSVFRNCFKWHYKKLKRGVLNIEYFCIPVKWSTEVCGYCSHSGWHVQDNWHNTPGLYCTV